MIDEEKINTEVGNENPEENLTEKDVEAVRKAVKKAQMNANQISPENQELFEKIMAAADMPIVLQDKDIKLGRQELDVRTLSRNSYRQMEFRQLVLNNVYLKQVSMSLTDITRLLMVIAKKLGVEDIIEETDKVIDEIAEHERAKVDKQLGIESKKAD